VPLTLHTESSAGPAPFTAIRISEANPMALLHLPGKALIARIRSFARWRDEHLEAARPCKRSGGLFLEMKSAPSAERPWGAKVSSCIPFVEVRKATIRLGLGEQGILRVSHCSKEWGTQCSNHRFEKLMSHISHGSPRDHGNGRAAVPEIASHPSNYKFGAV
jgi:hypothetical protein